MTDCTLACDIFSVFAQQALKSLAASNVPVTSPDFIKVKNTIEQNRLAG